MGQMLVQHGGHRTIDDPQGAIAILADAFSQVLVAGLLVAGLAVLSARSVGRPHPARRAVGAIGVGIVAALAVGPLWSDLLHRTVDVASADGTRRQRRRLDMATAPKILNDRPRRLIRSSIFRS